MNYTDKLEQAKYISEHGCSYLNCNTCQFIVYFCRIYKPDTRPQILKSVNQYIRIEKLKTLKNK